MTSTALPPRLDVPPAAGHAHEVPARMRPQRPCTAAVWAGAALLCGATAVWAGIPALLLVAVVVSLATLLTRWLSVDLAVPVELARPARDSNDSGHGRGGPRRLTRWPPPGSWPPGTSSCRQLPSARRCERDVMPRGGRGRRLRGCSCACRPAGASSVGLLQAWGADRVAGWAFFTTDLASHMQILASVQRSGQLDYGSDAYPRSWHMLLTLVSVPDSPRDVERVLLYDAQLVAAATWFALGLLLWTAASLSVRLADRHGAGPRQSLLAGLLTPTYLLLCQPFLLFFVFMGAGPSLMALVAMWTPLLAAAGRERPCRTGAGRCRAQCSPCSSWRTPGSLLSSCPLCALAVYGLGRRRSWREAVRAVRDRGWKGRVVLTGTTAVCLPLDLGPFPSSRFRGGSSIAAVPGEAPAVTIPALVVALTGLQLLLSRTASLSRMRAGRLRSGPARCAGVPAARSGRWAGASSPYYPTKALWFLVIFLLPCGAVVVARWASCAASRVWGSLGALGQPARLAALQLGGHRRSRPDSPTEVRLCWKRGLRRSSRSRGTDPSSGRVASRSRARRRSGTVLRSPCRS